MKYIEKIEIVEICIYAAPKMKGSRQLTNDTSSNCELSSTETLFELTLGPIRPHRMLLLPPFVRLISFNGFVEIVVGLFEIKKSDIISILDSGAQR